MRTRKQTKGIFCVEGLWDPDLRVGSTVQPVLELLRLHEGVDRATGREKHASRG